MKIVFVGPFGLQPKATMSTRALLLARALAARGHSVTILIPPWDDPDRAGQSWDDHGVHVVNIVLPPRLPLFFHILLTRTLVAHALAIKPEVIHFFKPKAYAGLSHLVLWWLRRLGGLSLRLVVDADDWEQAWNEISPYSPNQKKLFAWQEKWGLSHADAITVASRALEKLVIAQRGGDLSCVFYLPNGCNLERATTDHQGPSLPLALASKGHFVGAEQNLPLGPVRGVGLPRAEPPLGTDDISPSPSTDAVRQKWRLGDAPTILLYSRFWEFRLERMESLVRQVAAQLPQARWLMVGKGLQGEEKLLEARLAAAGLIEYVRFTGWLPLAEVSACFAAVNVAIYPYDDTLINRTKCSVKLIGLLEAGVPVVADAVGQNVEYIRHGISGVLTPPEDDITQAAALVALLQAPDQQQKLGQAARQYVTDEFNWFKLSQIAERAYRKC